MRVISKKPLREFLTFGSADYVDGFTIFDVGGNRYRMINSGFTSGT